MSSSTSSSDLGRPAPGYGSEVSTDAAYGLVSVRRFLPVLVVFALLFSGYQLLLRTVLAPAVYSENPAQSSLINVQAGLYGQEREVALVGSSISARLLDDFFAERGLPVLGLALDAQGPALGIELLSDADRLPDTVLVEINRSLASSSGNEATILDTVGSTGFDLARDVPGLRAEARPSSVLYSELKRRRDGPGDPGAADGLAAEVYVVTDDPAFDISTFDDEQREGAAKLGLALAEAAKAGTCFVLFVVPDKGYAGASERAFADHLSFIYRAPVIDLRSIEGQTTLDYTDHIHLDIPSARLVSHVLTDTVLALEPAPGCGPAG